MNISSFSPFCWVNPLFQLEKSAFLLHTLQPGSCTTHPHKVKKHLTRQDHVLKWWVRFYALRSHSLLLWISAAPSLRVESQRRWAGEFGVRFSLKTQWPVENTRLGHELKDSDVRGVLFYSDLTKNVLTVSALTRKVVTSQWPQNVPKTADDSEGIRYGAPHLVATNQALAREEGGGGVTLAGWGLASQASPLPPPKRSVMPPSYAIIFALRPISTWEQCKLFKTRFSGPAIIIMMISISVAIASDYLAGNFAAWGGERVFSGVDTHGRVRRGGGRKKEIETEKQRESPDS